MTQTLAGYVLTQRKFTNELLNGCPLDLFKSAITPFPLNLKLSTDDSPSYNDPKLYRSYVGKLNFLTHTRPDLAFAVQCLSQYMHHLCLSHVQALNHTLRYLHHTAGQGILLKASNQLSNHFKLLMILIGQLVQQLEDQ